MKNGRSLVKLGRLITWNSTSVRRRLVWGFSPLSLCSNPSTAAPNPKHWRVLPSVIYKRATIAESEAMSTPMILRYLRRKASILCTQIRLTNPGTSSGFLAVTHDNEVNTSCRLTVAQSAFTVVPISLALVLFPLPPGWIFHRKMKIGFTALR